MTATQAGAPRIGSDIDLAAALEHLFATVQAPRLGYRVPEAATAVGLSEREGWRLVAAGEWQAIRAGA